MMTQKNKNVVEIYAGALLLTVAVLAAVLLKSGWVALWSVIILAILEITFSFDNAIINSQVLAKMSQAWRVVFLTVGIAIAVFGVRLILPIVMVAVSSGSSMGSVMNMALHNPDAYSTKLHHAYPIIAAFGGFFLLMIALHFIFKKQDEQWLKPIERLATKSHHPWLWPLLIGLLGVGGIYVWQGTARSSIYLSAVLGITVFFVITILSDWLERRSFVHQSSGKVIHNWHFGLTQFIYLEVLDASFSFDGVTAAFAITKDVLLIAAGLGTGAFYVRSMTIHMLESGTLAQYKYLAHGAHYAILVLAIILILSIKLHIPEAFTALVGIAIVIASLYSSIVDNKRKIKAKV